jgi:hypothetical protein
MSKADRVVVACLILFSVYLWVRVNFLIDATVELDRRVKLIAGGLMELKRR